MYLNKLEIIGFKSFADKVGVDFDSGITAIVGPNGCGKTNIVDAVRWVIGEQKASVLRSTTMENVIFNGTKNRKPLGYAQVSLSIENTKGILPSEYSEITITRRCFRDGQSNYLLNGVSCRLKDITSLFMDTGMGADAYSVIELKMVNEILSHRTQDRRKLFEEAAGITKYKERRREALYKLEVAKENLTEANIEIRNRQRTVNAYEKIAQKQQEAKELSDKLKLLETEYHQRSLSRLMDETRLVESELEEKEKEREKIQLNLNENEEKIAEFRTDLSATESKLNESRDKLDEFNKQIADIRTTISVSEQRISYLKETIGRFTREKKELEQEIARLNDGKKENEDKIAVLNNTIHLMDESLSQKKSGLEEVEEKVKHSKDELKDLTSKHAQISKIVTDKRSEYELIKSKLENQLNRCKKLGDDNISNLNKISELDKEASELEIIHTNLKREMEKRNEEYEEKKKIKDSFGDELNQLEKEILNRSHEAEKIRDKIEFQNSLLVSFEDYSEGVKYISKDQNLPGADLVIGGLEVDDKFKVAIETALGEISNYLIVSDKEKAQSFISILKEKQKGKVTFILKDNLYNSVFNIFQEEFPEILKHEGVYGWADKFIKCPDEYFLLYRYLLDEYIIVENLDIAYKLSKDNFIKFITLDGDIVTQSFLRAGSSTNIETLKIGRLNLIASFQKQAEQIENDIEIKNNEREQLEDHFSRIDIERLFNGIQDIRSDILTHEGKLSQIQYQKGQINSQIDANNRENETLTKSTKELTTGLDKLITEIETAENSKYQREKELEHFTTELESLADELSNRRDEFNSYMIEFTRIKAELTNAGNQLTRINDDITTREATIKTRTTETLNFEDEIEDLMKQMHSTDEQGNGTGLKDILGLLEDKKKEIENNYNIIKSEYDLKKNRVDNLDSEQKRYRDKRDYLINFVHEKELQLTKDRIEINEHKEKIRDEYEIDITYTNYEDNNIYDFTSTKYEIDRMKYRLRQLGGTGQMELGIYEQEKKELERMIEQKNDLINAEDDLINLIEQINSTAQDKFKETFEKIRNNFNGIFRELFMEGDEADLKLVTDPDNPDPLDAKIDIIAKPRGKRPQLIDLLSGGEKTLTAIALLFAIYQVKPSPFCILDEVDAPLDDANIDRFVKIIRKFSENTQFIIVTHNKRTMEAADSMYGITMAEEGISTIVNVKFNDREVVVDNNK
ncbi:MAG: chromosome segregation protein SMC [Ignavibacteria bacterium]